MLVDLLLARVLNPEADSSVVMKWAEQQGFGPIVSEVLRDQINHHVSRPLVFLVNTVCKKGQIPLLKLLLTDPRIDPSVESNAAIRTASQYGQAEVVKLLLADPRVDPSADNSSALRMACLAEGQVEVVKLLLADKRVDPSARDNLAFQSACYVCDLNVMKLLLADPRVDPSACFFTICQLGR
jgi:hypothetical protein